ncbi:hypothetical protein HZH68_005883 [Vespula germanica]|uniref:Uncharacterized protein n=1 Tax=Vespula germanica TaxID=30212 RepID=A0A834KKK6_VESGE|nr:hypothetical protein HZH68_005883 [Vespula germanica]
MVGVILGGCTSGTDSGEERVGEGVTEEVLENGSGSYLSNLCRDALSLTDRALSGLAYRSVITVGQTPPLGRQLDDVSELKNEGRKLFL